MTDGIFEIAVMLKYPKSGFVKTRLAKSLGDKKAAAVAAALIERTFNMLAQLPEDLFSISLHCDTLESLAAYQALNAPRQADFYTQSGADLGEKMHHAASLALEKNDRRGVIIIGTDCPELQYDHLRRTRNHLVGGEDLVFGPALDGGYYLVGLTQPHRSLFTDVDWGTEHVLAQSMEKSLQKGLRFSKLPELRDLDNVDDLCSLKQLLPHIS